MKFWVQIEDGSGNIKGNLENVGHWEDGNDLNKAATFSFSVPLSDPKVDIIAKKRIARVFQQLKPNTKPIELAAGIIDNTEYTLTGGTIPALKVSGDIEIRQLMDPSVLFLEVEDGSGGPTTTILTDIFASAPTGWTLSNYTSTLNDQYAQFAGESVLAALVKVSEKTGENFRYESPKKINWLRKDWASSGIRAVQHASQSGLQTNDDICLITKLGVKETSYDLFTRIYPYGSGNAVARSTLNAVTDAVPTGYTRAQNADDNWYIEKDAAVTEFGTIERTIEFKDIGPISNTDPDVESAANMLQQAALEVLSIASQIEEAYTLDIAALKQQIYPGTTIKVEWRGVVDNRYYINLDETLYILGTRRKIDSRGERTTGLIVANVDRLKATDAELIAKSIQDSRVVNAYPQIAANSNEIHYVEDVDDSHDAEIRFYQGSEVTQIQQVLLRFRVDPLRSNSKGVSAGGGGTSGAGGGTTTTSSSNNTAHGHLISVTGTAGSYALTFNGGLLAPMRSTVSGAIRVNDANAPHTHTITLSNHTHTISSHTHPLTYGIFEESTANTLSESDLVYKVNGGSDLAGDVVSLGSDWYALDITDEVIDSDTYRPTQEVNNLIISTSTSKTARIYGFLLIRNFIQATANL